MTALPDGEVAAIGATGYIGASGATGAVPSQPVLSTQERRYMPPPPDPRWVRASCCPGAFLQLSSKFQNIHVRPHCMPYDCLRWIKCCQTITNNFTPCHIIQAPQKQLLEMFYLIKHLTAGVAKCSSHVKANNRFSNMFFLFLAWHGIL